MHKIIFVFILTVLFCSCSQSRQHTNNTRPIFVQPVPRPFLHEDQTPELSINTITSKELINMFPDSGVLTSDMTYWKPSREWIMDVVYPYYKKFLTDQEVTYSSRFDCDDFSRTFCVLAQLYYYNYEQQCHEQGVAIAEVQYHPESLLDLIPYMQTSNHAINVIVLDDGTMMFFEPQSGQQVVLTEKEKKSIYLIKF